MVRFVFNGWTWQFAIEEVNSALIVAGKPYVIVVVNMLIESREDQLIGSVLVRQDPFKATVLATLDAVNRRVQAFPAFAVVLMPVETSEEEISG